MTSNAMPFLEHLSELRRRLVLAVLGLVPCIALCVYFQDRLLTWITRPYQLACEAKGIEAKLGLLAPLEAVMAYLQLTVIGGVVLASPWVFYQLWAFVSPGLHLKEKRMVLPLVVASVGLFLLGVWFGHAVVIPFMYGGLLDYAGPLSSGLKLESNYRLEEYLNFSSQLLLGFGLSFQVPVVVVCLARLGLVDWKSLLKFFRYWAVLASIIAAVLTPPDVASQLLMLAPLLLLYLVSVFLAYLFGRAAV